MVQQHSCACSKQWSLTDSEPVSNQFVFTSASFPDVSLAAKGVGAQGMKGRGKDARRLADFVFKMAECSMADDYAIFKKEHRPVCFANFEGKVVFPHPVCQEEAVFLQLNGLQHHYRIRQLSLCPFHAEKLSKTPASDLLEQKKAVRQWCSQCICYTLVACWSTAEAKKPVVISVYLQLVCEISNGNRLHGKRAIHCNTGAMFDNVLKRR